MNMNDLGNGAFAFSDTRISDEEFAELRKRIDEPCGVCGEEKREYAYIQHIKQIVCIDCLGKITQVRNKDNREKNKQQQPQGEEKTKLIVRAVREAQQVRGGVDDVMVVAAVSSLHKAGEITQDEVRGVLLEVFNHDFEKYKRALEKSQAVLTDEFIEIGTFLAKRFFEKFR